MPRRKQEPRYEATEVLAPSQIEEVTEEDEPIVRDFIAQVNRQIRQKFHPGRACYIYLRPWPSARILAELKRRVAEHWQAEVGPTGWRSINALVLTEREEQGGS